MSKLKIVTAAHAGFCGGVKNAVDMALELAGKGTVYSLGPLAHNEALLRLLSNKGIVTVEQLSEVPKGAVMLIRTHGVIPDIYTEATRRRIKIVDATCPYVTKLQKLVAKLTTEGKQVIIIGDPAHPEVKGLVGWGMGEPVVISELQQVDLVNLNYEKNTAVVAQTTQKQSIVNEIVVKLRAKVPVVNIYDTICQATVQRQLNVRKLAAKVDVMVVVGGKQSSNTRKLAEICSAVGTKTILISEASELDTSQLKNMETVGVTAGASTPDWMIKEVIAKMENEMNVEKQKEQEVQVAAEDNLSMERKNKWAELEQAHENGTLLTGKVKEAVQAGLVVDLGEGYEGFMPGSLVDIRFIPDFSEFVNQEITFKLIEIRRDKEKLILSRKQVLEEELSTKKEQILKSLKPGQIIDGTVKRLTNFGAFVDVGGIDGLVHISEISWHRIENPSEVLNINDEIKVKVIEVIPERDRIGLSVRQALADPWTEIAKKFKVGEVVEGTVTRLVDFGVFVELTPGVEGLVHISQLADYHVKQASEVVQQGDTVKVKILDINQEAKRVSLSMRDAAPRPKKDPVQQQYQQPAETVSGLTLGDVFGNLFDASDNKVE